MGGTRPGGARRHPPARPPGLASGDREPGEDLRLLLFNYSRQRDVVLAARFAEVDPDWQALDLRFQTLLQTRILDGEQRRRAEELRHARTLAAVAPPR